MIWGNPDLLFALWIVPLLGAAVLYAQKKRRETAARFADQAMVQRLMPMVQSGKTWLKAGLLMTASALLIIACARPRFGEYFEEVSVRGVDLMVLLDVSRSMLAEDVAPNRLQRAKSDIIDLLQKLKGDRVGLIAFAGAPAELVPLTTDHGFFKMVLSDVDPDSAPRGGSLIGDAIRKGMEAMPQRGDRDQVLVLITDGEDQDSFPQEAAEQAAERGIRIITVGLGDTGEGARIPRRNEDGSLSFVQYEGQEIWSQMDEELLRQIALTTSGAYVPARTTAYDLGRIYEDHLSKLSQGELQSEQQRKYREQFQWFGGFGFLLLLLESLISHFKRAAKVASSESPVARDHSLPRNPTVGRPINVSH